MYYNLDDFFSFGFTNNLYDSQKLENNYNLNSSPLIMGKKVDLDKAIIKIKNLINEKKSPHFDGLICDQKSIDSVFNLAEKTRASINHYENDEINNFYSAYQKYGSYLVSFNELKNRSDLLVVIGNFEESLLSKFIKKLGWSKRKIKEEIFLFSKKNTQTIEKKIKIKEIEFSGNFLSNFFNNNKKNKKLETLQEKIKSSKYPVIVINPKNGFLYSQNILKSLEYINNNFRILRLFRLSGLNNSSGFVLSSVSKTGYPNAINFTDWGPIYDPFMYNAIYQKSFKDVQIFFSNLSHKPKITKFKRNIFIGHPNFSAREKVDVFVPVKTPGIDMDGVIVRSDGASLMKLPKKIESNYMEISQIINLLIARE